MLGCLSWDPWCKTVCWNKCNQWHYPHLTKLGIVKFQPKKITTRWNYIWTLKSAPWWCTSKHFYWSVDLLVVIHQGSSCLSQSFLLNCPPWRYNELWVMILQTAGNGTQAERGLSKQATPEPPQCCCVLSFPARSNGPIIWNECETSAVQMWKQGFFCQRGNFNMFFMVKALLLSWRFFPSAAISRWCQCRRLGIHPSSQIPSAGAFDEAARDLREPSAASLELLGVWT